MKYVTFEMSGIEVLRLGCQHEESNAWPLEHWRRHDERWRLFTPAIDAYVTDKLVGKVYGSSVTGMLLQLEMADFSAWPPSPFRLETKRASFLQASGRVQCTAQLSWPEVGKLSLVKQFEAYVSAVMAAVDGLDGGLRIPKDFQAKQFKDDLFAAFKLAKPSQLTRTSYLKRKG